MLNFDFSERICKFSHTVLQSFRIATKVHLSHFEKTLVTESGVRQSSN